MKTRRKNFQNPFFAYYNINSLRFKFNDLKEILSDSLPDVLVFAETKLDKSFSNAQFFLSEYYEPTRKDFSCHSGGIIEYIRKGIIRKRLDDLELNSFESIASEITINKEKTFLLSFYRTERQENRLVNIKKFFQELTVKLDIVTQKYDNIVIMGDINIDFHNKKSVGYKELSEFLCNFGLTNLIKDKTCFFKDSESSIDCILTNNPRKYFNSKAFELGISDCHKMIGTFSRKLASRQKTRIMKYRSLRNFKIDLFLKDLSPLLENINYDTSDTAIDSLINILTRLLDKHAPIKEKKVRGNQSRFMNKELSKAIMNRARLRSRYLKNKTSKNRIEFKRQRNLCVFLKNKAIKSDFDKAFSDIRSNSKPFYNIMKPYLTNKGALCCTDISLIEDNTIVTNDYDIANIFIDYYTNIVEHTSGSPPKDLSNSLPSCTGVDIVIDKIIDEYKSHPSILMINDKKNPTDNFAFKTVSENEVFKLIKSLDAKKAIGVDGIPPLILKLSAEILSKSLTKIINQSIRENNFPSSLKLASILPFFKKNERSDKKNYRPVSVLSSLSKIFGKIFQNQIIEYIDSRLSKYISAYRKAHSTQHVLMRMIEDWKKALDNKKYVGAILMDLSKAFDCISHDLLIAKLRAYGFEKSSLRLIYSYLKGRRQCVKINGTNNKYMTIKAGVPQGSILGPLLFIIQS